MKKRIVGAIYMVCGTVTVRLGIEKSDEFEIKWDNDCQKNKQTNKTKRNKQR